MSASVINNESVHSVVNRKILMCMGAHSMMRNKYLIAVVLTKLLQMSQLASMHPASPVSKIYLIYRQAA